MKLLRTSIQVPVDWINKLEQLYPKLTRSEAIRMAIQRAIEDPCELVYKTEWRKISNE